MTIPDTLPYEENIFLCDHMKSPFILGLVRPKIYLPSNMDTMAMEPVIAHEKAHLARRDHWWKPIGFLILTVHWFNPLCWIAYVLLCRDIELACDEKVIRQMDLDGKKQYPTALLECSAGRRLVTICPLAFGEIGVKERVKNVLNYKKLAFWVIAAAVIACAVVTVCFAANPKQELSQEQHIDELRVKYPEYFELGTYKGLEVYVWQMAENGYRFGLMEGTNREKTLEEKMALKGAAAEEMALILSTYDIEDKSIFVTPWQNPISGYMVTENMVKDPEYINNIRFMLGLEGASTSSTGIVNIVDRTKTEGLSYDTAVEKFFEDGENEYYFSGIYSHYVIVRYEDGSQEDIVTALNAGRATIADLDKFEVDYIVRALGTEN